MAKKPKFNFIYNDDNGLGFGKGYYLFFQGIAGENKGQDLFGCYYPLIETKGIDFVSIGVLNNLAHYTDMGWQYDMWYKVDLTKIFKRKTTNYNTYGTLLRGNEKMYSIDYHYIHYIPSSIVKMIVPECLLERTKQALAKDSSIIIGDIEEI